MTWEDKGHAWHTVAGGRPILTTTSPILQVTAYHARESFSTMLVRTWTTILVGYIERRDTEDDAMYAWHIIDRVHTHEHIPTRQVDACLYKNALTMIDTHGHIRMWDMTQHTGTTLAQRSSSQGDRFGTITRVSPQGYLAANATEVYFLDDRAPEPSVVAQAAYSTTAMQQSKYTSVCASSLYAHDTVCAAVSTTDVVEYYDLRYPNVPLQSWSHRRGHDRSLRLHALYANDTEVLCLTSRRNRLTTAYQTHTDPTTKLLFDLPSTLPSAVPLSWAPEAPSSSYWVDMASVPGATAPLILQMEQTQRGDIWMQSYATKPAEPWDVHVTWTPTLQAAATQAQRLEDSGPFGEREATHMDFRAVHQRTYVVY